MAAQQKDYHIGEALYKRASHHDSFEKLWETKWKAPVSSTYYLPTLNCS